MAPEARRRAARSWLSARRLAAAGRLYGRGTGVGAQRSVPVEEGDEAAHGLRLLRSHAGGAGALLPARQVRAMLAVRANQLLAGGSGIQPAVVDALTEALRLGVHPAVPVRDPWKSRRTSRRAGLVSATVNRRRRKKLTGRLMAAVMCGEGPRVNLLLRAGADPAAADAEGTTPLYAACVQGSAGTARRLLAAAAPPDAESAGPGAEGTPLCAAACWGHTDTVRVLLAHGADPNLREDHGTGWTPLEWAAAGPHPETVAVLRAAGAR